AQLAFAGEHPLHRGEPFEAHRAPGVQAVGGNADLRTQAILEAVGKTGGQVHIYRAGVDLALESVGGGQVLGHDRFSVLGAVAFDVGHGLVDAVDDANGQYGLQIFGEPVVFGGGQRGGQDCPNVFAAAQFDPLRDQGGRNAGQQAGGDVSVHQQGLDRAADAVAIGLGVDHDVVGLGRVGGLVEVDMAIAVEMLDERYPSLARKSFDQALPATRNDDVDVLGERDHFTHSGAVGGVDDLYG